MKLSKVIFSLILSISLFNSTIAMEADSDNEENCTNDIKSENETQSERNKFDGFMQLPTELQFMILYFDLTDFKDVREILKRVGALSLVDNLIKDHMIEFKKNEIWHKIAIEYVTKNSSTIVQKLIDAAKNNNIKQVRFLILGKADFIKNAAGHTALFSACEGSIQPADLQTVTILAGSGANLNVKCARFGITALIQATHRGYVLIVKILIAAGANLDETDLFKSTALNKAASSGETKIAKLLVNAGAYLNKKDDHERTPLIWAAINGYTEIVNILLNKGADINAQDMDGKTAAIWATYYRHAETVNILLNNGADINTQDKNGKTAAMWATYYRHAETAKILGVDLPTKARSETERCILC